MNSEIIGILNFLKNVRNVKTYKKIEGKIKLLEEYEINNFRSSKDVSHFKKERMEELKICHDKIWYRLFFVAYGNCFYFFHAFEKKTNKTPPREIKTAFEKKKKLIFMLKNKKKNEY